MRKLLTLLVAVVALAATACSNWEEQIEGLNKELDNLEERVTALEEQCQAINANIVSLHSIVIALQNNDYVTGVTPITEGGKTVGYTISFTKSGSVTIYHGKDGKDGVDGHSPQIGVMKDLDGVYYWTLDGEWLVDGKGNKIKAVGTDGTNGKDGQNGTNGKDGVDGKDGKDGVNGQDGADGVTPQLKIENDYWYVSYDNGASWTPLYRATGENGKDGIDGKDGDSFFSAVSQDENNLYLTLADGTELTLPLASSYLFNRLQSVCFVPRYNDGAASVYISASGVVAASYLEMDFEVSPKDAVSDIVESWESILSIQAVNTLTRAIVFIDLPVTQCVGDVENGVITVRAAGENLGESFFDGTTTFSARLGISDGNTDIKSAYVPLVATELAQPNNEIWYTATEHIGYFMYEEECFGSKIVSHTFNEETGAGVIAFEKDLVVLESAIRGRSALLTLSLPNSVTELGTNALSENQSLTEVKLGKGLKTIGESAFASCNSLLSIKLPNGLVSIAKLAFNSCRAMESVSMPDSVTSIGESAFAYCTSLKSLTIPHGVEVVEQSVAYNCWNLEELILSEGIKSIGVLAFAGCNLSTVTIPSTVAEIGNMAFNGNEQLASVYCKPVVAPELGGAVFDETLIWLPRNGATRCGVIYVPASAYDSYVAAESWNTYAVYAPVYQDAQILMPYNFAE